MDTAKKDNSISNAWRNLPFYVQDPVSPFLQSGDHQQQAEWKVPPARIEYTIVPQVANDFPSW